jgi:hypothetical protein
MFRYARRRDWVDRNLEFSDDPLREFAYALAEWAITFVGPIFWMCLGYLFLAAELGR